MNGSGLAVVQALGASRNIELSRQVVPEAEASRLPFHCSHRVSAARGRGRQTCAHSDKSAVPGWASHCAGHDGSETHRAVHPTGRPEELPEATDNPNRKALTDEETKEGPEDRSDQNNS